MSSYWGRLAHISEVPNRDTSPGEIRKLTQVSQKHTCYQMSMNTEVVKGIVNADGAAKLYNKDGELCGEMTMREVLLKLFKTKDGTTLAAEVHQQHGLCPTEVVIPGSDEAAAMVAMMNRQVAAFCYFYLLDQGLPEQFAHDLVAASCCPEQVAEIPSWKWDSKRKILVAPKGRFKERTEDLIKEFEALDCYKTIAKLTASAKPRHTKDPRARFNLDEETSIGTMHARNEERRRQQKARNGDSSGSGDEEGDSEENESTDSSGSEVEVVETSKNINITGSDEDGDDGQLLEEERSWKEEDEDGSEGSSDSEEGTGASNEGGNGWEEDDIVMEDLASKEEIEINSQSDSSSTGSNMSKSLSAEDNEDKESDTELSTSFRSSKENGSSPARAAGDE